MPTGPIDFNPGLADPGISAFPLSMLLIAALAFLLGYLMRNT